MSAETHKASGCGSPLIGQSRSTVMTISMRSGRGPESPKIRPVVLRWEAMHLEAATYGVVLLWWIYVYVGLLVTSTAHSSAPPIPRINRRHFGWKRTSSQNKTKRVTTIVGFDQQVPGVHFCAPGNQGGPATTHRADICTRGQSMPRHTLYCYLYLRAWNAIGDASSQDPHCLKWKIRVVGRDIHFG